MLQWPLETAGGRSNSKHTAMRENIQTPIAQGACAGCVNKNLGYTNHPYTTKIFQFLQKNLGMSAGDATFTMQTYKNKCMIWRMFMSSSMKAAIHLGPNYLTNSEIYKNTKFEEIESLFNVTQKLVMEHSEEILIVIS